MRKLLTLFRAWWAWATEPSELTDEEWYEIHEMI